MEAPEESPPVNVVLEQLARVQTLLEDSSQRAAHREAVIDRLHEENQRLREGDRRLVLEPVFRVLIRVHDMLSQEAVRLNGQEGDALLAGLADEVELMLSVHGVEAFAANVGDVYRPDRHRPLGAVATSDPATNGTVAEVLAPGFRDEPSQRVLRPAQVNVHQYRPVDDLAQEERP